MKTRDMLARKGCDVVTVTPHHSVLEAMRVLVEHQIGAVVVVEGGEPVGILSERDVLRLGAEDPHRLESTRVGDAMTADLVVGLPDDRVDYVAAIMTRNRIRHLPILEEGRMLGIVSIGDVVNTLRHEVEADNRHLRNYIQGTHA